MCDQYSGCVVVAAARGSGEVKPSLQACCWHMVY